MTDSPAIRASSDAAQRVSSLEAELAKAKDEIRRLKLALTVIAKQREWDRQAPIEWVDLFVRTARAALSGSSRHPRGDPANTKGGTR